MDFISGLVLNCRNRTYILVFVERYSKMTHLVPIHAAILVVEIVAHLADAMFLHHGLPDKIVSDRDPRFT